MYCLPDGYVERLDNEFFDDTPLADEYQKEVYEYARQFAHRLVTDVGCGSAYKLVHNFPDKLTLGIDLEPTVNWLREKYPDGCWEVINLDRPAPVRGGLVICADVIEHIPDPDKLLAYLYSMHPKTLVLSTPDRSMLNGIQAEWRENGPPVNPCHVREWSFNEFEKYVAPWFKIEEHFISNKEQATQVLRCSSQ